jgi:hypothetical protein
MFLRLAQLNCNTIYAAAPALVVTGLWPDISSQMVHTRAAELAIIDGRSPKGTTMSDLAQAKRELTGETD